MKTEEWQYFQYCTNKIKQIDSVRPFFFTFLESERLPILRFQILSPAFDSSRDVLFHFFIFLQFPSKTLIFYFVWLRIKFVSGIVNTYRSPRLEWVFITFIHSASMCRNHKNEKGIDFTTSYGEEETSIFSRTYSCGSDIYVIRKKEKKGRQLWSYE